MLKSLTVAGERFRIKYLPEPRLYFRREGTTVACDSIVDLQHRTIVVGACKRGYETTKRLRDAAREITVRLVPFRRGGD